MQRTKIKSEKRTINQLESKIGKTPLFRLPEPYSDRRVQIYAKLEWQQLGSSIKARPAFQIFKDALESGDLYKDKTLLDASSGNTAIAYAAIGAFMGIPVHICLPSNASSKRKGMLRLLGAELTLTSPLEGTDGAQEVAREIKKNNPDKFYYADQYSNPSNWKAHKITTGPEILEQLPEITHFVCGLGTTGTFMGTRSYLKQAKPSVKIIGLQPDSPMHGLEGWKHMETAQVPPIYDTSNMTEVLTVDSQKAISEIGQIASKTGLLLSPSSAANLLGALQLKNSIEEGIIATVFPDDLLKYDEILKKLDL